MDFRERLMRFMSGRYGVDTLFFVLIGAGAVLSVCNLFLSNRIVQGIVYLLVLVALFRAFSRNISRRKRENDVAVGWLRAARRAKELHERRRNDRMHVYKKCPSCKAILRLPRRPGSHTTVCPKCGREFTVRVRAK